MSTPEPTPETTPEPTPEPTPRREAAERLRTSLRRPSRAQAVVAVLLAALGFGVVTQIRSAEVDDSFAGLREQELIDVLSGLAGTNQRSQDEIARLETARDELRSASSQRRAALREAQTQADALAVLAGTVPVTGPGIEIRIEQGDEPVSVGAFLDLVQELRAAGAEALAVDDEVRLVAQSYVEQGPDGVVVDGVRLRSPYVVQAIGDPDSLAAALPFPEGPVEQLERDGATVRSSEESAIEITAVVDAPDGQ